MRDKILQNQRYGVLEVGSDGIITACNNKADVLLADYCRKNSISSLTGLDISSFGKGNEQARTDCIKYADIISLHTGVTLVDSFTYPETGAEVIRFTGADSGLFPFLNLIRYSSSVLFELDKDLNFVFASESFFKLSRLERHDLYGLNLSCLTSEKDYNRFRTSIDDDGNNQQDYMEVDEFLFSFNGSGTGSKLEVYPLFLSGSELCGYLCFIPDGNLQRKCAELGLTLNRMNEVVNFAGTVSHDCNNALTAVLGNISLAKMESQGNGELDELLADAESAALKIKNLTEKLGVFIRSIKSQNK